MPDADRGSRCAVAIGPSAGGLQARARGLPPTAIKRQGGYTIVQDPDGAATRCLDCVLPLAGIGLAIVHAVTAAAAGQVA